mgnify:FL=1
MIYLNRGLGAVRAGQEVVVTSAPAEPAWLANVKAYLADPMTKGTMPGGEPPPEVVEREAFDWGFWAKTLGIAVATTVGFFILTRV